MGNGPRTPWLRRTPPGGHRNVEPRPPPPRPLVEHLSTNEVSQDVLRILKIAQQRVGAIVPGRTPDAGTVTLYARHASNLVDGLITLLPKVKLSQALRGSCLEIELGI